MGGTRFTKADLEKKGFGPDEKGDWEKKASAFVQRSNAGTATHHDPRKKLFAKGRLASGTMNKTEGSYARYLDARKFAGEIIWWGFEKFTIKLAEKTRITPDFGILFPDGSFEFHDVKGAPILFQDDAKAKMKIAAAQVPFRFFVVYPRTQKLGGGFDVHEINPDKSK